MNKPIKAREYGLSLIELMVAILIGLIVTAAAASIWVTNKKSYSLQEDLARIQENGRFAMEFIKYDIRMAGYYGCADDFSTVTNHVNDSNTGSLLNSDYSIQGLDNKDASSQWMPGSSTQGVSDIRTGTDAIMIRYLKSTGIVVEPPYMPVESAALHVSTGNGLMRGDIVAVTDCNTTDIFQISDNNPDTSGTVVHSVGAVISPGNSEHNLSKSYEGGSFIRTYYAARYYIGTGANGGPALMRQVIRNNAGTSAAAAEELVEGVEDMQILYGVDTGGSTVPDAYVTAASLTANSHVRSVRLALLVRSVDQYGPDKDTRTYLMLDGSFDDPNDEARRRRVFRSTILARNLL